jgi:Mg-chelatase subunit ChlD
MMRGNGYVALLLFCCGTAGLGLAAACGDSGDGSSSGASGASGSGGSSNGNSGFSSGGFGSSGLDDASSGGASGGNGDASFNPDAACAATNVAAEKTPANILFIVDRSGSMNCNPPPDTTSAFCETHPTTQNVNKPTKWTITRDALKSAIAAMPATHSAGLTFFNTDDDCAVVSTPNVAVKTIDSTQLALVNSTLDAVTPKGLTPIVGGVTLGYDHLHTTTGFDGKKILVLLTDGEETCAPEQKQEFLDTTVKNALAVGIRTFVIGAPGSETNRAFLSQVAFNGGTAKSPTCNHGASPADQGDCHFDLTNAGTNLATELNAALDTITKQALGCEFDVPTGTGPIDYDKVNVIYGPSAGGQQTIGQDTSKACDQGANGWQYSADRKRIVLCGQTCSTVKGDPGGSVSIALGCLTETVTR